MVDSHLLSDSSDQSVTDHYFKDSVVHCNGPHSGPAMQFKKCGKYLVTFNSLSYTYTINTLQNMQLSL